MNIQISFYVNARAVVIRMLKNFIIKELKRCFVEVKGFFIDNGKIILNAEVEEPEAINEILNVIFNKTGDDFKKTYFTGEVPIYGKDVNVKMIG